MTVADSTSIPSDAGATHQSPLHEPNPPCIRIEDLHYRYEADIPALNGVTLEIAENAYLGIVGQNGSGKTTLVKHLNGLLKPTSGRVWVYGVDTATVSPSALARTVGYVFQNPDHQIFCPSTEEEVSFGPRNLGLGPDEVRARTEEALRAFGLMEHAQTPPAVLGFGLRRLVSLAAVYAMRPRVLILDEPTCGLDWRSAQELLRLVDQLHAAGHTILLVSHDMRLIAEHARQVLVMHEGRVLAYGPTREVFQRVEELRTAQVAPPQVMQLAARLARYGVAADALSVPEFCAAYHRARQVRR